ncbi:MAG: carboxylesterase family protein, partial [Tidjanibacter sp.]|nr:carboxylesterase family protein [Tidjanibacter sp.]
WLRVPTSPVIDGYAMKENFSQATIAGHIADVPYMIGGTLDDMGGLGAGPAVARFCTEREKAGGVAYAYQFARKLPGDDAGAFHSSELWFMFKSLRLSWRPFTEGDYDLAERMITAWTNFAATGNPNGKGAEGWTPFTEANPEYMVFRLDEGGNEASSMVKL